MNTRRISIMSSLIALAALVVGVASCGGGGTTVSEGGIGGTGITQGSITGFGSIWVNGVEFDTTNATIDREGSSTTQDDLSIGMVVTIDGTVNADGVSGSATTVSYGKTLEGPVSSKPNANTLVVLGQTVIVDNATRFNVSGVTSPTINDVAVSDIVEVSGYRDAASQWHATYVEAKLASSGYELNGTISATSGSTVTIGSQVVDISGATQIGFGSAQPTTGDYVEVQGSSFSGANFVATVIERKSAGIGATDSEHVELEAFITGVTSATEFTVGVETVRINAQTNFDGGTAAAISVGLKVQVEGAMVGGVLTATKVEFEDGIEIEANVAAIDSANHTLTLTGINGVTLTANDVLTEYTGVADFSGITVGSHVAIRGREYSATGCTAVCVLATELELSASSPDLVFSGPIDATPSNPTINIMGISIDTSAVPDDAFSGDGIATRAAFFAAANVGDIVSVTGMYSSGSAAWEEVELDN